MKKLLSMILILALLLCLCACKPADSDDGTAVPQTTGGAKETTAASAAMKERELFYQYLADVVVPEIGLADLSAKEIDTKNFNYFHPPLLKDAGFTGLAAAAVRDFDGNGTEEMVTFTVAKVTLIHTWLQPFYGEDFWNWDCLSIEMDLYTIEDGAVVHKDHEASLSVLDGYSWGPMVAGLEQCGDTIYLWGKSHMEDPSTYGCSPFTVYHIENDEFVFDYAEGFEWGQISLEGDFWELNTTKLDIHALSLGDIDQIVKKMPNSDTQWYEKLGDRLQLEVYLSSNLSTWGVLEAQGTDHTNLKAILSEGVDAYPVQPLPQEELLSASDAMDQIANDAYELLAEMTIGQGLESKDHWEEDGKLHIEYVTHYNEIRMTYDAQTGKLLQIMLLSEDSKADSSWYSTKDALLQHEAFGLKAEEVEELLGKVSWTKYSGGLELSNATVGIAQVMSCVLNITFK